MKKFYFLFLFALIASIGNLYAAEVTDVITASNLKATGTTYVLFSNVKVTSEASYSGQSAQTGNNTGIIQLNSKKKNSRNIGIVSTVSGGLIKSVSIEVDNSNAYTYSVYAKKTAYSAIEDLYNDPKQGNLILESKSTGSLDVAGEYYYIGIRSKSGAVKIKKITITYVNSSVATPTITPNGGDVKVGDKITFATKTDGATLSYSTDGGQTWTQGSEYTATTVGALNLWVKATKGSDESAVAKATFNVVDPNAIGSVNINITADKTAKTGELFGTMTVAVPMPINATVMDVVIKKGGKEFSSDKNLTAEFSKEITETGTYEIEVIAMNDNEGITEDKKTAEFYSNKLTDIADFLLYGPECNNLFGSDVVYEFTCPLSVTYANGSNLWVTDGTDGMLIFQRGGFSTAYTNGTVFAKGIKGQYTVYNNTIELTEPVLTETTEGATVDPKQIEIAAISADNQNQFVIIKDAVLNVKNETFADAAGNTVDMYDKKFCTVPADGTYDVVGIVSYFGYSGAVPATQVYPLAFLTAPTATLGFTAAEINEMSWLAANDKVLTEDGSFEDINASCVKLTCEEGAQIEYTLDSGEPSPSTATVESGTEIGFTDGESYMLTVCAVKGGYKSASREYMFSIGKTSSVSSMSAEGVKVVAAEGGVEVVADEAAEVAVYTVAGQLVRQARVAEGSTLVNVAPGFYVVRANGTATKVIVR